MKKLTRSMLGLNEQFHTTLRLAAGGATISEVAKTCGVSFRLMSGRLLELERRGCLVRAEKKRPRTYAITPHGAAVLEMGFVREAPSSSNTSTEVPSPVSDSVLVAMFERNLAGEVGPVTAVDVAEMLGRKACRTINPMRRMAQHGLLREISPKRGMPWSPGRSRYQFLLGPNALQRLMRIAGVDWEERASEAKRARVRRAA